MLHKLFADVLGIDLDPSESLTDPGMPTSLQQLVGLNSQLADGFLKADVRILAPAQYYSVLGCTIFAEESQGVSMWGFKEPRDEAKCFQVVNNDPLEIYEEDGSVGTVVTGMLVTNLLSSDLLPHWFSSDLTVDAPSQILKRGMSQCGVLSNVRSYIYKSVVCNIEFDRTVRLDAASQSTQHLNEFKSLVKRYLVVSE